MPFIETIDQVFSTLIVWIIGLLIIELVRRKFYLKRNISLYIYIWHTLFSFVYILYLEIRPGDAQGYYLNALSGEFVFLPGTVFIEFFTSLFIIPFNLSYLGAFLLFNIAGSLGLLAFHASLQTVVKEKSRFVKSLALITVFLPSVSFWTVAIGKDSLAFMATGFILWAILNFKKAILKTATSIVSANMIESINNILPSKLKQRNIKDKYQKFKNAISSKNFEEMFINASSYVDNDTLKKVFKDTKISFENTAFNLNLQKEISALDTMMLMDYKTFMVDDVLTKVDRASMSVSIEAREPLLDHKIIEYSATIPQNIKYKNGIGKYLLKEVLYKYVPKELIERPKSGFQIPLEHWLRTDLKELVNKYISKERLEKSDIYNVNEILKIKQELFDNKTVNISLIWFVLMFEMWKEEWIG